MAAVASEDGLGVIYEFLAPPFASAACLLLLLSILVFVASVCCYVHSLPSIIPVPPLGLEMVVQYAILLPKGERPSHKSIVSEKKRVCICECKTAVATSTTVHGAELILGHIISPCLG